MRIVDIIAGCMLASVAAAQGPTAKNDATAARALFSSADRDGDGRLTPVELSERRIAVAESEFRDQDADKDGAWSRDEFTVHYRSIVIRSGERPAADLEAEVVRVLALRRAGTCGDKSARPGPAVARISVVADPASCATPEILELDARIERAIRDVEDRAAGRGAVRADFDRVRGPWNERVTIVRALGDASAAGADVSARFSRALDALEARARAGSIPRAQFAELRAAWSARPRRAEPVKTFDAADPRASVGDPRFERALTDLEARVHARIATPADWGALREATTDAARRAVQGADATPPRADDPRVVRSSSELLTVIDRLEKRASAGTITRVDFAELRALAAVPMRTAPAPGDRDTRR